LVELQTYVPQRGDAVWISLITNQIKGYPFEVLIPVGLPVTGVFLADQVKSLDWRARNAEFTYDLPAAMDVRREAPVTRKPEKLQRIQRFTDTMV